MVASVEALEEVALRRCGDSDPLVGYGHERLFFLLLHTDHNFPTAWTILHGILQQILYNLLQAKLIPFNNQFVADPIDIYSVGMEPRAEIFYHALNHSR